MEPEKLALFRELLPGREEDGVRVGVTKPRTFLDMETEASWVDSVESSSAGDARREDSVFGEDGEEVGEDDSSLASAISDEASRGDTKSMLSGTSEGG